VILPGFCEAGKTCEPLERGLEWGRQTEESWRNLGVLPLGALLAKTKKCCETKTWAKAPEDGAGKTGALVGTRGESLIQDHHKHERGI